MKIFSITTAIFVFSLTLGSCKKDFLNVVPKGQQLAVTTNDYNLLLNSRDFYLYTAGGWHAVALMGDDIAAEGSMLSTASVQSQNAFNWSPNIYKEEDIPFDINIFLSNMYVVNKVINEVMESTEGSIQQKTLLQAEAMANRAFLNFQFINFYAKPYLASTAASDPGFPMIKFADINQSFPNRGTVQETYDFIISDLTKAIADLPVKSTYLNTRFNRASAEGILGKVYLFMGRYSDALTMLDAAVTDNAQGSTPARLYNYNQEFSAGGKFLPIFGGVPSNSPGENTNDFTESLLVRVFYNGYFGGNQLGSDFVVLSPKSQALFGSSDLRLNFFAPLLPYYEPNPSGRLSKFNAASYGRFGLQLPELYLMRAEAKARTNDLAGAISDLEILRKTRMPLTDALVPATISANQASLIRFIIDERTREFATEGYRWFDMRRLSSDPIFASEQYSHLIYLKETGTEFTSITLNKDRLTLKLPFYIMNSNPNFTNNP